ncbi:MAG: hypothetical protein ACR2OW_12810 [Methyloligellaceae bacterium]
MSTTTYIPSGTQPKPHKKKGVFTRFFERVMEAQLRVGERKAAEYFRTLSDSHLQELGFTTAEIRNIRRGKSISAGL